MCPPLSRRTTLKIKYWHRGFILLRIPGTRSRFFSGRDLGYKLPPDLPLPEETGKKPEIAWNTTCWKSMKSHWTCKFFYPEIFTKALQLWIINRKIWFFRPVPQDNYRGGPCGRPNLNPPQNSGKRMRQSTTMIRHLDICNKADSKAFQPHL